MPPDPPCPPPPPLLANVAGVPQVLFEPMSMHSASRCVNGTSRYVWVCSYHDRRALSMPHKLYQEEFNADFVDQLAPELRPM